MSYEYIEFVSKDFMFMDTEYDNSVFEMHRRLHGRHHLFGSSKIPYSDVVFERSVRRDFRLLFYRRRINLSFIPPNALIDDSGSRIHFNLRKMFLDIFQKLQNYSITFIDYALLFNALFYFSFWFSGFSYLLYSVQSKPYLTSSVEFNLNYTKSKLSYLLFGYQCMFILERFLVKLKTILYFFGQMPRGNSLKSLKIRFFFFNKLNIRIKFIYREFFIFFMYFISHIFDHNEYSFGATLPRYTSSFAFLTRQLGDLSHIYDSMIFDISCLLNRFARHGILRKHKKQLPVFLSLQNFHPLFASFMPSHLLPEFQKEPYNTVSDYSPHSFSIYGKPFRFSFFFYTLKFNLFMHSNMEILHELISWISNYYNWGLSQATLKIKMPNAPYSFWPLRQRLHVYKKKSHNFFLNYDLTSKFCNTMMLSGRRSAVISVLRRCFVFLRTRLYRVMSSRILLGCILKMRPDVIIADYRKSGKFTQVFVPVRHHTRLFYAFRNLVTSARIERQRLASGELDTTFGFALFNELYAVAKGNIKCRSYKYYNDYHEDLSRLRVLCRKKSSLVSVPKDFNVFGTYNSVFRKARYHKLRS